MIELRSVLRWRSLASALFFVACLDTGYVLREQENSSGAGQTGAAGAAASGAGGTTEGGAGSPPNESLCDRAYQPGTDFAVCRASGWGSAGEARLMATVVEATGHILIGGQSLEPDPGVPTLTLTADGAGLLQRIDGRGKPIAQVVIGSRVNDVALLADGVLVATDLGSTLLSSDLERVRAEQSSAEVLRVAASSDTVVMLSVDGRVRAFDASLVQQSELPQGIGTAEDVAIDPATGWRVVTGGYDAPKSSQCQGSLPFIRVYDADGNLAWSAYDTAEPLTWCASSTGKRVVIRGSKLFYAGEQQGGNSVHLRDPRDPNVQAPLISYDDFSSGAGKAIDIYSFVARFDLLTGELEAGQVVLPRDGAVGGVLTTTALAVDDQGRIFLGGQLSCCIQRRDERRVAGMPLGPYAGPEASLLILSADLRERLSWTSFTGSAGPADAKIRDISVRGGLGAVAASSNGSAPLLAAPAKEPTEPVAGGYLVIFPAP